MRITVNNRTSQEAGRLGPGIRFTRSQMGFIFQQFNVIVRLPVLTNVLIGLLGQVPRWRGNLTWFTHEEKHQALACLERVGLKNSRDDVLASFPEGNSSALRSLERCCRGRM